jgi:ABC-type transport system involved in Fe-S cluster assembly fused permease/ATPase subunit
MGVARSIAPKSCHIAGFLRYGVGLTRTGGEVAAAAVAGTRAVRIIETIVIMAALVSLWPLILGYEWAGAGWYRSGALVVVLLALVWVTARRLSRIRSAAEEAKRKRDEAERSGRPPWLGG